MGRLNEPCAWLLTQQSSSWSENRLIYVWFTFVRWNSNSYIQVSPAFTLKTNSFTLFDSCCCCLWARMQVQRSTAAQKHPDNKPAESGQSFTASSHTRPHFHHTHTHTQGKTSSRWVREPITGSMGPIFSAFVVWSLAHCADMQASEWFIFTWGTEAGRARRCCHFSTTKDAQH